MEELGGEWVLARGYLTALIKEAGDLLLDHKNLPCCCVQKNTATRLGLFWFSGAALQAKPPTHE